MIECGYPRNDILFNFGIEKIREIKKGIGISEEKKVVLYVPTFREYMKSFEFPFDLPLLKKYLENDYLFLFRSHHLSSEINHKFGSDFKNFLIDVTAYPDVQELLLIADILITDYSSIMFDFAILNRPIINFIDDYEVYNKVRGMYFDIYKEGPGLVVNHTHALIDAILERKYESQEILEKFDNFRKRFCEFENGHAAEYIVRNLIVDNM